MNFLMDYTTEDGISDVEGRSEEGIQNATQTQRGEKEKEKLRDIKNKAGSSL